MSKFKVLEGAWKGQVGEFVRQEFDAAEAEAEKAVAVVLRMAGARLVEFAPERVEAVVEGEPEAKPEADKAAE